jgi:uncharacterized protein
MSSFEWDEEKNILNQEKHNISFEIAQEAFFDEKRLILEDLEHTIPSEKRFFCIGKAQDRILTVRFTMRGSRIRIFGAGYWRKGKKIYEQR